MKPIIKENFADNGAHSHWSVIDADNGDTVIKDVFLSKKLLDDISSGYERVESDEWICFSLTGKEAEEFIKTEWGGRRGGFNR